MPRRTKIICTLGPASKTLEQLRALAESGMDVARLNFSHGTHEGHGAMLKILQALRDEGHCIATMLDTGGPAIRTGDTAEPFVIHAGDEVIFSSQSKQSAGRPVIHVNYDGFSKDVLGTDRIIIDNGSMIFDILSIEQDGTVFAKSQNDGTIGSRRHVNLPGADIGLPSVTKKDWEDIAFGVEHGVDFVALSFVRSAENIIDVRQFLTERKSTMQVIAKIETKQAIDHLEEILLAADGVMIARGDLGAEIPYERIPAMQDKIVRRCRQLGKPVIVATHMLESMTVNPFPTRAEITDVAHAAVTGTDATMLSGETASGKYPLEALRAMVKILAETEEHAPRFSVENNSDPFQEVEARARAAVTLAESLHAAAIVPLTRSGRTARAVSKYRPRIPIVAGADTVEVQRSLCLSFGVSPFHVTLPQDTEQSIADALHAAVRQKILRSGDCVVVLCDAHTREGQVGSVQVRTVP